MATTVMSNANKAIDIIKKIALKDNRYENVFMYEDLESFNRHLCYKNKNFEFTASIPMEKFSNIDSVLIEQIVMFMAKRINAIQELEYLLDVEPVSLYKYLYKPNKFELKTIEAEEPFEVKQRIIEYYKKHKETVFVPDDYNLYKINSIMEGE